MRYKLFKLICAYKLTQVEVDAILLELHGDEGDAPPSAVALPSNPTENMRVRQVRFTGLRLKLSIHFFFFLNNTSRGHLPGITRFKLPGIKNGCLIPYISVQVAQLLFGPYPSVHAQIPTLFSTDAPYNPYVAWPSQPASRCRYWLESLRLESSSAPSSL